MLNRRTLVGALSAGALVPHAFAQQSGKKAVAAAPTGPLMEKLTICIPAGVGGGLDLTGRALGAVLVSEGVIKEVTYDNKAGKGGTLGLVDFHAKHNGNPHALMVGGVTLMGGVALHRPLATLKDLSPIARVATDYVVVAVTPGAKHGSFEQVLKSLKANPSSVTFCGGSTGGADQMMAAMIMRAASADVGAMKYIVASGAADAIQKAQADPSMVLIAGYSEFKPALDTKVLLPLGVSSRKPMFGAPSLRDHGVNAEISNWRMFFSSANISEPQKDALRRVVVRAVESAQWKKMLDENRWTPALMVGKELKSFLDFEEVMAATLTSLLRLR